MPSSAASGHRKRTSGIRTSSTAQSLVSAPVTHQQNQVSDPFEPCTATASFFIYAQRNVIRCLHHDTLAIERKFETHKEDVLVISADNVSERGAGRLIVSYDAEQTAIVWDLLTGDEVSRFASYEVIRVASWMRDGNLAFGNSQGNVILFEPSTSEHISARTIYDPITALAPAFDCTTFAIGYQNGSILIATLQPSFTILHTLNTPRTPSPITGLAWHNSSAKQKTGMLASQAADGDLQIWSIPQLSHADPPRVIRALGAEEPMPNHKTWFAWSKNGRIVQFCGGNTRVWDVRTKKVTHESVPTIDDVLAIAAYGPNGVMFTLGRSYSVQQYDLVSQRTPLMVTNVQHAPPNAPPTPPDLIEESKLSRTVPRTIITEEPTFSGRLGAESSGDEGFAMSPLQKISRNRDEVNEESRDQVGPLSPMSSHESLSSASSRGYRSKSKFKPQRPAGGPENSMFSTGSSIRSACESTSIRSVSSTASQRHASSTLRFEVLRSPDATNATGMKRLDLFPNVRARMSEVKFRPPQYGKASLTPDVLRKEMLNVVFGWDGDADELIRDEQSRQRAGSASSVLLSKWLGDLGADAMAQLVGSESMTSSDWMLLALSCQMGEGSQKQVGEAFVKRLLETGEIHPAVAILLGLGEPNEAVEVYVSRRLYLEAVLLTCLVFPNDWQRQSYLVRKWGESAISHGEAELAVRCFSCTTIESSEPWFSPRSQDAVYQAQQRAWAPETVSKSASIPDTTAAPRLTARNTSLRLITKFDHDGLEAADSLEDIGATPIVDSAATPNAHGQRRRDTSRDYRDRSQSRTATPGGIGRKRLPSVTRENDASITPLATTRVHSRLATPALKEEEALAPAIEGSQENSISRLHSVDDPAIRSRQATRDRSASRNRNNLQIAMMPGGEFGTGPTSGVSTRSLTESVPKSAVSERSIDRYIDSLDTYGKSTSRSVPETHSRAQSQSGRSGRSRSRAREAPESGKKLESEVMVVVPKRQSPSSPVPMTTPEPSANVVSVETNRANDHPSDSKVQAARLRNDYSAARSGSPSAQSRRPSTGTAFNEGGRNALTHAAMQQQQDQYGRQESLYEAANHHPVHLSRPDGDSSFSASQTGLDERDRLLSQNFESSLQQQGAHIFRTPERNPQLDFSSSVSARSESFAHGRTPRAMTRKELAAKELEERRLSLSRRPSVPNIPHPADLSSPQAQRSPRTGTDPFPMGSSRLHPSIQAIVRSQTAGPESTMRHTSTTAAGSFTPIGLPATPKAMQRLGTDNEESMGYFRQSFVPIVTDAPVTLAPVSYQPDPKPTHAFGPLLPSSVYSQKAPILRSYSAPPENVSSPRNQPSTKSNAKQSPVDSSPHRPPHIRKGSTIGVIPEVSASFEDGLHDENDQIIVVTDLDTVSEPPVLAELAHLSGPPPPPPPPTMFQPMSPTRTSGVIDIVMDDMPSSRTSTTTPPFVAPTSMSTPTNVAPVASPPASNCGVSTNDIPRRPSSSSATSPSTTGGIGGKWRNVAGLIRSSSRSRTKSPPMAQREIASPFSTSSPAPYETVIGRPLSSYFQPQHTLHTETRESSGTGGSGTTSPLASSGYRNPKEIRANMTPDMVQAAVGVAKLAHEWNRV